MRFRKFAILFGFLFVITAAIFFTRSWWLAAAGRSMVRSDALAPADAILVLGGDFRGNRVLTGCRLLKSGLAPVAFVSGAWIWYGINEAEAAIHLAVKEGCSQQDLLAAPIRANSTLEEARAFRPLLQQRNIRKLLLVTSNYHTSRAGRIFENELGGSGIRVTVAPAPDPDFDPESWWHTRQGQKTFFYEFTKTMAHWVGL